MVKKPVAKKPVAIKLATKKFVAKKPVVAKPATKKPAVVKPATKKPVDTLTYSKGIGTGAAHVRVAKKRAASVVPTEVAEKPIAYTDEVVEETKTVEAPAGDAPRIECRLLVGDLSLPIDAASLEHTLGAGSYGYGRGLVDSWPDDVWASLLSYLKLPAEPLDRDVAAQPVKRLVQRLWYEAIQGGVPDERKAAFAARDAERAAEYKENFTHVEKTSEVRKERAKTSFGRTGETKYVPTAELKDKAFAPKGQAALLLEAFKAVKFAPLSTRDATEGMVKAGLKTTTKPERIAAFYLCQWSKAGKLERA